MREFLLCILICCLSHLAFGQDSTFYGWGGKILVDTSYSIDYDKMAEEWQRQTDLNLAYSMLRLMDEYWAECWADSTGHLGFWFTRDTDRATTEDDPNPTKWWRDWDSMGFDLERLYNTKAVYRYSHRDPTFPGFMEFLKRKVKP